MLTVLYQPLLPSDNPLKIPCLLFCLCTEKSPHPSRDSRQRTCAGTALLFLDFTLNTSFIQALGRWPTQTQNRSPRDQNKLYGGAAECFCRGKIGENTVKKMKPEVFLTEWIPWRPLYRFPTRPPPLSLSSLTNILLQNQHPHCSSHLLYLHQNLWIWFWFWKQVRLLHLATIGGIFLILAGG